MRKFENVDTILRVGKEEMKITGTVEAVYGTVQVTEKFKRRQFVLTYWNNPEHVEYITFECHQERCALLDGINKGDKVTVSFNLKGRMWKNEDGVQKYINTIQAWNIEPNNEQHPFFK